MTFARPQPTFLQNLGSTSFRVLMLLLVTTTAAVAGYVYYYPRPVEVTDTSSYSPFSASARLVLRDASSGEVVYEDYSMVRVGASGYTLSYTPKWFELPRDLVADVCFQPGSVKGAAATASIPYCESTTTDANHTPYTLSSCDSTPVPWALLDFTREAELASLCSATGQSIAVSIENKAVVAGDKKDDTATVENTYNTNQYVTNAYPTTTISNTNTVDLPECDENEILVWGDSQWNCRDQQAVLAGGPTTNTLALDRTSGLTSTVNAVVANVALPGGVLQEILGFDAAGNPVYQSVASILSVVTTNTLTSAINSLTSTVNGIPATASIINSNTLGTATNTLTSTVNGVAAATSIISNNTLTNSANSLSSSVNGVVSAVPVVTSNTLGLSQAGGLSTAVNGVVATQAVPLGTALQVLAFDASGSPVYQSVASVLGNNTTNTLTVTRAGGSVSTVNGVISTVAEPVGVIQEFRGFNAVGAPVYESVNTLLASHTIVANTSLANALSTTVNGVTGATVPIINSSTLGSAVNTLTSTINGVVATASLINSNTLSVSAGNLSSTVNGVVASTPLTALYSNALGGNLTQSGPITIVGGAGAVLGAGTTIDCPTCITTTSTGLTGDVVAGSGVLLTGTATDRLVGSSNLTIGIDPATIAVSATNSVTGDGSTGSPLQLTNDVAAPGSNFFYGTSGAGVKGWQNLAAAVSSATTNTNGLTRLGGLTNTVNGVVATTTIPSATLQDLLGFDAAGNPVYQSVASILGAVTTNVLSSATNTLTSNVNGIVATAPIVNSLSNTSTTNTLTTTVNGVTGAGVPIINSNVIGSAVNTLTSTVNGVGSTANIINSNTNGLTRAVGLVTVVNGVSATTTIPTGTVQEVLGYDTTGNAVYQSVASILSGATTNTFTANQATGFTSTVNGIAATVATPASTISNFLGYDTAGDPVYQSVGSLLSGATTNTLASAVNTLTSTVNGVTATSPLINSNTFIVSRAGGSISTINGVAATQSEITDTIQEIRGFNTAGAPVYESVASVLLGATTVSNTSAINALSTTVNGVAGATVPIINSNTLGSAVNTLTSTINGVVATSSIINSNALTVGAGNLTSTVNGVATSIPLTNLFANANGGDLTSTTSAVSITGGTGAVLGGGATVDVANYVGATNATPGTAGLVNPAAAGEENFVYTGAGTWVAAGAPSVTSVTPGLGLVGTLPLGPGPITLDIGAGNGISVNASDIAINAPTCAAGEYLSWNGTAFQCIATTNALGSATNTLTSTMNGVVATSSIVNSNFNALTRLGGLVNTVNGVTATTAIPTGTLQEVIGYDAAGAAVYQSVASIVSGATTNTLNSSVNTITATVNGVIASSSLINSNTLTVSRTGGYVSTVNGVAATQSEPTGTVQEIRGFDAAGNPVYETLTSALSGATTVSNTSAVNALSTTVNGVTGATVPIINSSTLSSAINTLTSTINGVVATSPIINTNVSGLTRIGGLVTTVNGVVATTSIPTGTLQEVIGYDAAGNAVYESVASIVSGSTTNTLNSTVNTLTSTVNGVVATSSIINSLSNTSAANTLSTTVNGVTGTTVPIINSNTFTTTRTGGSTSTVNGVAATQSEPASTVQEIRGFDAAGNPVYESVAGVLSGATTNTLGSAVNTLTSTVNGVAATAPIVNSVSNTSATNTIFTTVNGVAGAGVSIINSHTNGLTRAGGLTSAVNGVTASTAIASGTADELIGYDTAGNAIYQSVSSILSANTTNTKTWTRGAGLTTTVNGVAANVTPATGTIQEILGYNAAGAPVYQTPAAVLSASTTNTFTANQATGFTSTVNGVTSAVATPASTISNFLGYDAAGDPVYQSVGSVLAAATTVSNTSLINALSTTVNGVTGATVPLINSSTLGSVGNTLTSTINGVVATSSIINSNVLGSAVNTLTSTVNGVGTTTSIVNSISNTSAANTLFTTVNGVAGSGVSIINSNANGLTRVGGLVTTVNGVVATTSIPTGTLQEVIGYDAAGNAVYESVAGVLSAATTVSNTSATNTLSTTVNGVTGATVPIINSNTAAWTRAAGLSSTVNGVAANVTPTAGTIQEILGYNAAGAPVYQTPASVLTAATTNTLGSAVNTLTSTVNGVVATSSLINSNTLGYVAGTRTLTSTVNGVAGSQVLSLYVGATNVVAGTSGLVNPAAAGEENFVYTGAGTWVNPSSTSVSSVTPGAGLTGTLPLGPGAITLDIGAGNGITVNANDIAINAPTCASGEYLSWNGTAFQCIATTNTLGSAVNTLTSTVNGVIATSSLINSNTFAISRATGYVSTVNGVAATQSEPVGTVQEIRGFNAAGAPVYQTIAGVLSGATTNTFTADQATGFTSTVNGIVANVPTPTGTINNIIGYDVSGNPVYQSVASLLTAATTVSNTSAANSISTTVNGVTGATVPIINSSTLGSAVNTLTTTINGVVATAPIVNSISNTSTVNTLTTTVNGVAGTGVSIINSNTLGSAVNTLTSTVNGVGTTASIINSNANGLTRLGGLTNTVNGVVATTAVPVGSIQEILGFDTTGNPVYQTIAGVLSGATTNAAAWTRAAGLTSTVNGVAANVTPTAGTIQEILGYDAAGLPVYQTPAALLAAATTNTLGSAVNTLTSTVNGVAATSPIVNSVSNTSAANTISTTVNGVAGATVPIINSNTLGSAVNTLTSTVNGVAATGSIINSNVVTWTQAAGLTSTVNGVASTVATPAGTLATILGYDSTGAPVRQALSALTTTADNGLTINPANNVQLGGTLIQDTVVADGSFNLGLGSATFSGSQLFTLGSSNAVAGNAVTTVGFSNVGLGGDTVTSIMGNTLNTSNSSNAVITGANSTTDTVINSFLGVRDTSVVTSIVNSNVFAQGGTSSNIQISFISNFNSSLDTITDSFVSARNGGVSSINNSKIFSSDGNLTSVQDSFIATSSSTVNNIRGSTIFGIKNNFDDADSIVVLGRDNTNSGLTISNGSIIGNNNQIVNNPANNFGIFGSGNQIDATQGAYIVGTGIVNNTNDSVQIGTQDSTKTTIDSSGRVTFLGALSPNGNDGSSGEVLTSQGAGNVPVWTAIGSAAVTSVTPGAGIMGTLPLGPGAITLNVGAGNGITVNANDIAINAPTCLATQRLSWNGSAFACVTTTNTLGSAVNTLTSTVNGVIATSSLINSNTFAISRATGYVSTINGVAATQSEPTGTIQEIRGFNAAGAPVYQTIAGVLSGATTVSNTSSVNALSTTVNGVTGATVPIINSNVLGSAVNTLTSTVNGVGTTTSIVNSISNTSAANTLLTTVNGVAGTTVAIINSNTLGYVAGTRTLTSTVNGVAANQVLPLYVGATGIAAGVSGLVNPAAAAQQTFLYQGAGTWISPAALLAGSTTNTLGSSVNTLTSTVNGVAATSPIVNTVSNTSATNTISTTVNGVAGATVPIINSNTLGSAVNTLTSTVNGVAATGSIINSNVAAWTRAAGLTSTVNGVAATFTPATGTIQEILGYNAAGAPVYQTPASVLTAATTNTLGAAVNTLTSTVNGVIATSSLINSNTLGYVAGTRTLTSTVNGVAASQVIPTYVGATGIAAGVSGLVNPAAAGEQNFVYTGAGTWVNPSATSVSSVTPGAGLTGTLPLGPGAITLDIGAGNGITVNANDIAINAPTCAANQRLSWNGTAFACATTTNTLGSAVNTLTSTVDGVIATSSLINSNTLAVSRTGGYVSTVNGVAATQAEPTGTIQEIRGFNAAGAPVYQTIAGVLSAATTVSNTSATNTISTTVNGVTGATVPIINSSTLGSATNTLISTINGVVATAPIVNTVSNTSATNTISTTINGVAGTGVNIINSNVAAWTRAAGLTNTVNGVAANVTPATGTIQEILGYNAAGAPVYQTPASVLTAATTNTLGSAVNTLTSTVNGVIATSSLINSNTFAISRATGYVSTINGVAATQAEPTGTIQEIRGFNAAGAPVYQTIAGVLSGATTNTLGSAVNTLTSTVNGVVATGSIVNSISNTSAANTLSTTVNGVSGSTVSIVNSISNTSAVNSLTTTVNGVAGATVAIINSNVLGSAVNTLTSTVNGVGTTASIINSNTAAWTRAAGLTNTTNGVAATVTPAAGTIQELLGYNAAGAPVYQTPASVLTAATTNTLGSAVNTLTSTVNGVVATGSIVNSISNTSSVNSLSTTVNGVTGATVPIINSISNTSAVNTLSTTVNGVAGAGVTIINSNTNTWTRAAGLINTTNGVAATLTPASGTIQEILGYNAAGAPVYQTVAGVLSGITTNTLGYVAGTRTLTSTVNGVAANQVLPLYVGATGIAAGVSGLVNPAAIGEQGFVYTGAGTWVAPTVPISSLTAAVATNSIDNLNFNQTWNWNSATTQTGLSLAASSLTTGGVLSINSTNAASTGNALSVSSSGTAATALAVTSGATTGNGMTITAASLTTGNALRIAGPTDTSTASDTMLRVRSDSTQGYNKPQVVIGSGDTNTPDTLARDQLYVFGRINTSWNQQWADCLSGAATTNALTNGLQVADAVLTSSTNNAGNITYPNSAGVSGICRLTTPATVSYQMTFGSNTVNATEPVLNPVMEARVFSPTSATQRGLIGFSNRVQNTAMSTDATAGATAATNFGTSGVFFRKNAADGNWSAVTANGGTATTTNVAAATTNAWHRFRIEIDSVRVPGTPEARFYVDGTLVATHTTNLPTSATKLGYGVSNNTTTAAATTMDVDYMRVWSDDPPETNNGQPPVADAEDQVPPATEEPEVVATETETDTETDNADPLTPPITPVVTSIEGSSDSVEAKLLVLNTNDQIFLTQFTDLLNSVALQQTSITELLATLTTLQLDVTALTNRLTAVEARLSQDISGSAKIQEGDQKIEVTFDQSYDEKPVVILTPKDFIEGKYAVDDVSTTGFTIRLSVEQTGDVTFYWRSSLAGAAPAVSAGDASTPTDESSTDSASSDEASTGDTPTTEETPVTDTPTDEGTLDTTPTTPDTTTPEDASSEGDTSSDSQGGDTDTVIPTGL